MRACATILASRRDSGWRSHVSGPSRFVQDLGLQWFERTVAKAKVVTTDPDQLIFQNEVLNASIADTSLQNVVFLEDYVGAVSETGHRFVSVINLNSNPQRVRGGTHLGTVVPVALVYRAIPQQLANATTKTEVDNDRNDSSVCKL